MNIPTGQQELTELTVERVSTIYRDCQFRAGDDSSQLIETEGVFDVNKLHAARLAVHGEAITAMLAQLSDDFRQEVGGGQHFSCACQDRHGNKWTKDDHIADQLIQLGIATGRAAYNIPRVYWDLLAGRQPYIVIL